MLKSLFKLLLILILEMLCTFVLVSYPLDRILIVLSQDVTTGYRLGTWFCISISIVLLYRMYKTVDKLLDNIENKNK